MHYVVLVESPNKRQKIEAILNKKFQDDTWEVMATIGHIKYLPKTSYSLRFSAKDFFADFKTKEEWNKTKKYIEKKIFDNKKNITVVVATDSDREGEVIAFQVIESLDIDPSFYRYSRVVFNSMNENEIVEAFLNPIPFNRKFYEAGIARRIIDRDVGYLLSDFIRSDFKNRYSDLEVNGVGRVSIPALYIIAKRYYQERVFVQTQTRKIYINYRYKDKNFTSLYTKHFEEKDFKVAENILNAVVSDGAEHQVAEYEEIINKIKPPSPLDNTSLLYSGWYACRFNERRTMELAQSLFEKGYITYHRSDSIEVSKSTLRNIIGYIFDHVNPNLLPEEPNQYKNSEASQEGHEAIVPTNLIQEYSPDFLRSSRIVRANGESSDGRIGKYELLSEDEMTLYSLIWTRTLASQMRPALLDASKLTTLCKGHMFQAQAHKLLSKGWTEYFGAFILKSSVGDSDFVIKYKENMIEPIGAGEIVKCVGGECYDKLKEAPKRYGRGQFIRAISSKGIGRPSTLYAIPDELLKKGYIELVDDGIIQITELGLMIIEWVDEIIPELLDDEFIKTFEQNLNSIAAGELNYKKFVLDTHAWLINKAEFYNFDLSLIKKSANLITKEDQDLYSVIKSIESEKNIIAGDKIFTDKQAAKLFIEHHRGGVVPVEVLAGCPVCEEGEISLRGRSYECGSCDFAISIPSVRKFISALGREVDEVFVERELKKSFIAHMPVSVSKILSKKGFYYDANFTFVKNNDEWRLEFVSEESNIVVPDEAKEEIIYESGENIHENVSISNENENYELGIGHDDFEAFDGDMNDEVSTTEENLMADEEQLLSDLEYFCVEESSDSYIYCLKLEHSGSIDLVELIGEKRSKLYNFEGKIIIISAQFDMEDAEDFLNDLQAFDEHVQGLGLVEYKTAHKQIEELIEIYNTAEESQVRRIEL